MRENFIVNATPRKERSIDTGRRTRGHALSLASKKRIVRLTFVRSQFPAIISTALNTRHYLIVLKTLHTPHNQCVGHSLDRAYCARCREMDHGVMLGCVYLLAEKNEIWICKPRILGRRREAILSCSFLFFLLWHCREAITLVTGRRVQ